ncbi:MAG: VWA domain-containing protein [Anaerolineaceae bacterium]|nr:MAG: VWA domain-containing protein [Anaerolineaceae bacterium]
MNKTLRLILTFGLLLSLTLLPLANVCAQGEPTVTITQVDTSKFPQVTVYISVTDAAGEPVNISASSLQVYENGVLMTPTEITNQGEIGPLTTLLVIDISGSMFNSKKIVGAQNAAKAYVEQMRPQDQAGVISFNTEVKVVQSVTSDRAALIAAIDSLVPDLDTAMFDALSQGVNTLAPIEGRKTIVLLSDGLDNVSQSGLENVISAIGPAGLSISAIGLGDPNLMGTNSGLDEPALQELTDRAGGVYRFASGPDALVALYEQLGRALQGEFSFTYISPSTLRDGVNRGLTVSISDSSVNSQYNPGGVLPEVSNSSLPLFGGILAGLLLLLGLPFLFRRGKGGDKAKAKSSSAKGRVKLK